MIELLTHIRLFFLKLIQSIETIIKILFLSRFKTEIKNIHPSKKEIVVLANGPSIKELKFTDTFKDKYDFLSVNFSTSSTFFEQIKPQYHIINAPELWKENVSEYYKEIRLELFNQLKEKVTWPLILFIPFQSKKRKFWQEIIIKNSNIKIVFYNPTPVEGLSFINHFLYKINLGMPRPHNIVIPSLIILTNIGYKNIYLLGVDHSWLNEIFVDEKNETFVCQKHFYDYDKAKHEPMTKDGTGAKKLHEVLYKFYNTFKGYFEIDLYAKRRKTFIYNSTKRSYIDAFDRENIL